MISLDWRYRLRREKMKKGREGERNEKKERKTNRERIEVKNSERVRKNESKKEK